MTSFHSHGTNSVITTYSGVLTCQWPVLMHCCATWVGDKWTRKTHWVLSSTSWGVLSSTSTSGHTTTPATLTHTRCLTPCHTTWRRHTYIHLHACTHTHTHIVECVLACKLLQVSIRPQWPHHPLETAKKGPNRSTTGWPAHYITSPDTAPRSHTTGHPLVLHSQQERPRTKTETQRTRPQAQTPHTCTYYRPQRRYHPTPYSSQYTSPSPSVPSSLTKRSPVPEGHVHAVLTAV